MGRVENLIRRAKKKRTNRAYYDQCFHFQDIRQAGLVQSSDKTQLERVQLDVGHNELIYLFGFDQSNGSSFTLKLSIVSLRPGECELGWRLAKLEFKLELITKKDEKNNSITTTRNCFNYEHEQLIDYEEKRRDCDKHEHRNVYKVGDMSIEQVSPFAFARILFTGLMNFTSTCDSNQMMKKSTKIPMRLVISTHPTCDKFDYKYRFESSQTARIIKASQSTTSAGADPQVLLDALLEDRFDQPLMFQGHLESLNQEDNQDEQEQELEKINELFIMWGAKVKKFHDLSKHKTQGLDDQRQCLFMWTECGQQIHLTRPLDVPNLCYGFVHSAFDYASQLNDIKLLSSANLQSINQEINFNQLKSFEELTSGKYKIFLRAFKVKEYLVEFSEEEIINNNKLELQNGIFPIKLNGFCGWAMIMSLNLGELISKGEEKLLTLNIHDQLIGARLAQEQLCGGKAQSLVTLTSLAHYTRQLTRVSINDSQINNNNQQVQVTVPRAIVVTTQAYKMWLSSNGEIGQVIGQLDAKRRVLATKSVHLNPMSREYVNPMEAQKQLRVACAETCARLKLFPLPELIKRLITDQLVSIFGQNDLIDELKFAIRSSAVGEDALETSAAGQMRTILGAQGLESIFSSIVDCWTSQFELEALTYKSQNGLAFNLPMGVVVQELINCHVAGVAATCDPLTGDPQRLEITANLGLGEGVVAGKQTDTVRVALTGTGSAGLSGHRKLIEKMGESCCLSEQQITGLANLLLELRLTSGPVREREVEWGITLDVDDAGTTSSSTSSSSSSSSSLEKSNKFHIHLLQSRPLTHLTRLTSREIDHELDYGQPSPLDIMSRANLGEVMPGVLCPMNSSWFMPLTGARATRKPYEKNQSRKTFVADAFAFHAQMATMVLTYADTLKRFSGSGAQGEDVNELKAMVYSMIGSTNVEPRDANEQVKLELFRSEKMNPLCSEGRHGLGRLLALDSGLITLIKMKVSHEVERLDLRRSLIPLEELSNNCLISPTAINSFTHTKLLPQIREIYSRLCTQTSALSNSWKCHIEATILSMALNVTCLKLLSSQSAYRKSGTGTGNAENAENEQQQDILGNEVLNDFSLLMREPSSSKSVTESGDISKLLAEMLESFVDENSLESVKQMTPEQLYNSLLEESDDCTTKSTTSTMNKSVRLFKTFMERNGHRAYREFCLSTSTWSDDCSYIVRMLTMRLKSYTNQEALGDREKRLASECERAKQVAQVETKLTPGGAKFVLLKYAIPRARKATIRREESKSLLIKTIHKLRLGFRHLGGLLCLAGLLPSASLIFYLTIEELDEVINSLISSGADNVHQVMPRLLYKARRRQQRARLYDKVNFPVPTLRFNDMIDTIRQQTGLTPLINNLDSQVISGNGETNNQQVNGNSTTVSGLVSCAGLVTGRACVINSLDEVDQSIQQGDILITYSIDISWSVYFFALAGIVTEVGGIVSHGAVVAREYGIPTLCTAVGACSKFTTGQMVTLDANRGLCYLASPANNNNHVN